MDHFFFKFLSFLAVIATTSPLTILSPIARAATQASCSAVTATLVRSFSQTLGADFEAGAFAANLDGKKIKINTGEILTIHSSHIAAEMVEIKVVNSKGIEVASGRRRISQSQLEAGSFEVTGDAQQWALDQKYARKISTLLSPGIGTRVEVKVDPKFLKIVHLVIDGKVISPPFPHVLQKLESELMRDPGTIRQAREVTQNSGYSNQGLATAVYSEYAKAVPYGTFLSMPIDNRETVASLSTVYDSPINSLDELDQKLLSAFGNTKWGKILKKAGWQPISVQRVSEDRYDVKLRAVHR